MRWNSTAIANEFLRRAKKDGKKLTQMQLQKLVYIADGWNLAINDEPLAQDRPQAWDYGPVYRELWDAVRVHGDQPITELIKIGDVGINIFRDDADKEISAEFTEDETKLIDRVSEIYSEYHAYQLSALTHQPGTPWHEWYKDKGFKGGEIPNELIREHFIELGQKGRRAS